MSCASNYFLFVSCVRQCIPACLEGRFIRRVLYRDGLTQIPIHEVKIGLDSPSLPKGKTLGRTDATASIGKNPLDFSYESRARLDPIVSRLFLGLTGSRFKNRHHGASGTENHRGPGTRWFYRTGESRAKKPICYLGQASVAALN